MVHWKPFATASYVDFRNSLTGVFLTEFYSSKKSKSMKTFCRLTFFNRISLIYYVNHRSDCAIR